MHEGQSKKYRVDSPQENSERLSAFQIVILVLSVLVLFSMLTDATVELPTEVSRLLQSFDNIVCGIFILDFCIRYRRAADKAVFMKWGWIDLVASIPNVDFLRWGRAVRILRIIRILRGIRSFHKVLALTLKHRIKTGLGAVLTTFALLVAFASIAILFSENSAESNIKTAEDAVWWSVTTITTVGYGDKYPITTEGRIIAIVLMAAGVGLFGTLSGLVASFFLGNSASESDEGVAVLTEEIRRLRAEVKELKTSQKVFQETTNHVPYER